jgi:hypothetical protein
VEISFSVFSLVEATSNPNTNNTTNTLLKILTVKIKNKRLPAGAGMFYGTYRISIFTAFRYVAVVRSHRHS